MSLLDRCGLDAPPGRVPGVAFDSFRALTTAAAVALCYPLDVLGETGAGRASDAPPRRSGVVLVPGYAGVPRHLAALRGAVSAAGFGPVTTMRYTHFGADVRRVAEDLVRLCTDLRAEHDVARVHLIGHSLGGIVIRYATEVLGLGADGSIGVGVTVSAPHRGTPFALWTTTGLAGWSGIGCGLQLLPESTVLRQVEAAAARNPSPVEWVTFSSDADMVVPAGGAGLDGAENVRLPDADHFSILWSPQLLSSVVDRLVEHDDREPAQVQGFVPVTMLQ